jgi:superoxide dismutase, Cu-Zn family
MKRFALLVVVAGCASNPQPPEARAIAELATADGARVGTVTLTQQTDGVAFRADVSGVTLGQHGFHIHAVGKCEAPFTSAGPHLNPLGRKHGKTNPEGPHAGDLDNISNGSVSRLAPGLQWAQLFDEDGSAFVLHADPDDYKTDPSGNSGGRIACGVIRRQ